MSEFHSVQLELVDPHLDVIDHADTMLWFHQSKQWLVDRVLDGLYHADTRFVVGQK